MRLLRRASLLVAGLFLIAGLLAPAPVSFAGSEQDQLEPYRAFVRTQPAKALLAEARDAMRAYWEGAAASPPRAGASDASPWPGPPVTVYVTLVGAKGTRACVGGAPAEGGLAGTVRALARRALHSDPRRPPVREEELAELRVAISFAGDGEPVADPMRVDPGREGLLIASGARSVAFLPGEARTVSWALREAARAGVLNRTEGAVAYRRFPVVVLMEPVALSHREESHAEP